MRSMGKDEDEDEAIKNLKKQQKQQHNYKKEE